MLPKFEEHEEKKHFASMSILQWLGHLNGMNCQLTVIQLKIKSVISEFFYWRRFVNILSGFFASLAISHRMAGHLQPRKCALPDESSIVATC